MAHIRLEKYICYTENDTVYQKLLLYYTHQILNIVNEISHFATLLRVKCIPSTTKMEDIPAKLNGITARFQLHSLSPF